MRDNKLENVPLSEFAKLHKELGEKEKLLKKRKNDANSQKNKRAKLKDVIQKVSEKDEEAAEMFKTFNRKVTGRPHLEVDQPGIL